LLLSFSCAFFPHRTAQKPPQSTIDGHQYFPPGPSSAAVLFAILHSLDEPSLFEAAKDPNFVAVRASYFAPVPTHEIAVRLVVNADGSGKVTSAIMTDSKSGVKRTQNDVSAADVNKGFNSSRTLNSGPFLALTTRRNN
jgi:hypothetical protein